MVGRSLPSAFHFLSRLGWWLLACWMLGGCAEDVKEARTELMLVADTDAPAPGTITFHVFGPDGPMGRTEMESGAFASTSDLPRTLALVHTQGPLGPFTVSASVEVEGGKLTRTHVVNFVRAKTLVVPLHLALACLRERCRPDQTCNERGSCVQRNLDSLTGYDETPTRIFGDLDAGTGQDDASAGSDGGAPDASSADAGDAGPTKLEICNGQEVDLLSNPDHCGACLRDCKGMRACVNGMCKP